MKRKFFAVLLVISIASLAQADRPLEARKKIYDEDGSRIFENLRDRMKKVTPDEEIPVILVYKQGTPIAGTLAVRLRNVAPRNVKFAYRSIPAVAARLRFSQIQEALKDPWVEHVELDAKMVACLKTARVSFGVDNLRKQFGFSGDADGIQGNFSKNDIVIAMADTGVDASHPDLRGKVVYWKDYIKARTTPYDDNGHGTHVAGVAAGAGKLDPNFAGVAPQAALVVFKILDSLGDGAISDGIAAVDEAITRKAEFNIRVFNLSIEVVGSSGGTDAFSAICNAAVDNGIVMVVAAGNHGPGKKTIGAAAAAARVITVGAGADTGERGFYLADFSSRGPTADGRVKPDLWGPGIAIRATARRTGYSAVSGTSFATPFVAGVVALMLDANPSLTPEQVKSILIITAAKWIPGTKSNEAGAGRLQGYQAVTRAAAIIKSLLPPEIPDLKLLKNSIAKGKTQTYIIHVVSTEFAIAITAVVLHYPFATMELELLSPSGNTVAVSNFFERQETIHFKPTVPGNYTLRVIDSFADTAYLLDISADLLP